VTGSKRNLAGAHDVAAAPLSQKANSSKSLLKRLYCKSSTNSGIFTSSRTNWNRFVKTSACRKVMHPMLQIHMSKLRLL